MQVSVIFYWVPLDCWRSVVTLIGAAQCRCVVSRAHTPLPLSGTSSASHRALGCHPSSEFACRRKRHILQSFAKSEEKCRNDQHRKADFTPHLVSSRALVPCAHFYRTNCSIAALQVVSLHLLSCADDMEQHPFLEGLKGSELKERRALLCCESCDSADFGCGCE